MYSQFLINIACFVTSFFFRLYLLGLIEHAFDEKCLHCVFNVFVCTYYAMISQHSMRSVSLVYSIFCWLMLGRVYPASTENY